MNDANIALSIYSSGKLSTDGNVSYYDPNDTWIAKPWIDVLPKYQYYWCGPGYRTSKLEKAFKIVQMLMDKKIVKITSVKKFVALVNKVSEVI